MDDVKQPVARRRAVSWRTLLPLMLQLAAAILAQDWARVAETLEELIRAHGTQDARADMLRIGEELLTRSDTAVLMEDKPPA